MKKTILKVATCLAIGTMGLTATSCDEEMMSEILNELLTNLTTQAGETYVYQAYCSTQTLVLGQNGYSYGSTSPSKLTGAFTVVANGTTADITLPNMTVNGVTLSGVRFTDLSLTANESAGYTVMSMSNEVGVEGTATVNGQQYAITNLFIDDAKLTNQEMAIKKMQVYLGENGEYVVELADIYGEVNAQ